MSVTWKLFGLRDVDIFSVLAWPDSRAVKNFAVLQAPHSFQVGTVCRRAPTTTASPPPNTYPLCCQDKQIWTLFALYLTRFTNFRPANCMAACAEKMPEKAVARLSKSPQRPVAVQTNAPEG